MKYLKTKRHGFLIFLLICVIFIQPLQSCSKSDSGGKDTVTSQNGGTEDAGDTVEGTTELSDDVPVLNFNGETVSILYRDYMQYEVAAEAENGEPVNDAVYRRNQAIEDRFNIKFNMIPIQGAWDYKDSFLNKVKNSVSAGDNQYEIVEGYAAYIVDLSAGGYLTTWDKIPYVNLSKPWWNQDFVSEMTVNNKLYFLTGDLALSTIWESNALFFNKIMWQNYGFEDPYAMVKNGRWTLDNMAQITKQVSQDVNGDGKYTIDDLYGYVTDTQNQVDAYIDAFDVPITKKDGSGMPQLVIQDAKFSEAFAKLYDFMNNNVSTFAGPDQPTSTDIYSVYRPVFQNQRALILAEYLGNSSQMRNYDFDFGILPYPKYDENQAKYQTMSQDGYTMFCIPSTVRNPEKVGAVIESLAAETRRSVLPAFYDIALKTKYARDDDSAEMIDIIRGGTTFNFGIAYVVPLGYPHLQWRFLITNKNPNMTSTVEKQMPVFQRNLEKVLLAYQ